MHASMYRYWEKCNSIKIWNKIKSIYYLNLKKLLVKINYVDLLIVDNQQKDETRIATTKGYHLADDFSLSSNFVKRWLIWEHRIGRKRIMVIEKNNGTSTITSRSNLNSEFISQNLSVSFSLQSRVFKQCTIIELSNLYHRLRIVNALSF